MDQSKSKSYYVKHNVEHKEYFMQQYVYQLGIVNVPEIIEYNAISKIMIMKKIDNNNLSDEYGEDAKDIPDELFEQVVQIVRTLVLHNIEYPDLTGYNFVEDNDGKIWIIDFEHSLITQSKYIDNINILSICNGNKKWNPDFK
tara:strand:+ start:417 stop:845 length:429 start_codon:yes stop_codon:yes gene_type:complete